MAVLGDLQKDFEALAQKNRLGQAYVLWGGDVAALFAFAQRVAEFLETGSWEPSGRSAGHRPLLDARFIDGTKQQLGIDVTREFASFLYKQPALSPRRTLVLSSASELTTEAQNAILKLVEEPPAHALILLVLRDVNSLLPALRSRFISFYVAPSAQGAAQPASEIEQRARELVKKVLASSAADRGKIIKAMVDEDAEIRDAIRGKPKAVHEEFIVTVFVRELIAELAKKPEQNWRVIKELLKRQSAIEDLSTSKKVQIEAALQFLQ